jgi:hypothetical protein
VVVAVLKHHPLMSLPSENNPAFMLMNSALEGYVVRYLDVISMIILPIYQCVYVHVHVWYMAEVPYAYLQLDAIKIFLQVYAKIVQGFYGKHPKFL